VPVGDPYFEDIVDVGDVVRELLDEIEHFFQRYKDLEPTKETITGGWSDRAEAERVIADARTRNC
jgi:inorganic pyrophosphatase